MKKSKKLLCLLFVTLMFLTFSVTAFASNTTNSYAIIIEVATNKESYKAWGVAEITATITNVSGDDINNVTAQAVFNDLALAGKRTSQTSKSVDVLKSGESFSFTYKATLDKDEHDLNIFQKIILWFVRLFNGGYTSNNNSIDVVAENVTEIEFGKFTAENVVQVGYGEKRNTNNYTYEELIQDVDIDKSYERTEENTSIDEETNIQYTNNIIMIMFEDDCTKERKAEIINSIDGKVVGGNETYDELHIEIKKSTFKEIEAICDRLNENEDIYAMIDYAIASPDVSIIPNDLWSFTDNEEESYTNWENPFSTANNWSAVAVDALGAWNYNDYFKPINIGVIDNGFSNTNPDLNLRIISDVNTAEDHGTHVAGIIGATANNKKGITGIVWNKNILAYDAKESTDSNAKMYNKDIYNGIEKLVKQGCKVINLSIGMSTNLIDSNHMQSEKFIKTEGKTASEKMAKLLKKGYDFIIVQSAGNGAGDGIGVDAINNGSFCSVTKDNCYTSSKISADEIMDRIIIVANAMRDFESQSYVCSEDSNGGIQVDIAAPGFSILSTVTSTEYPYQTMSGTSQAAPYVAGVASLVWSVNSDLTGDEVKQIVLESATSGDIVVKNNLTSPTTGDYYMVNAKLAVEKAIYNVIGKVIDNESNKPIENATVNCDELGVSCVTDKDGRFALYIDDLSKQHTFNFSHEYYNSVEITVASNSYSLLEEIKLTRKSTSITGTVTDSESGNPISNVTVEAIDNESDSLDPIATATTDSSGKYTLKLPYGDYSLSYKHSDYEDYGTSLTVNYESYTKDVTLSPKGSDSDNDETGESGDTEERTVTASGECGAEGDNVTWVLYDDGELVVSGSGEMADYREQNVNGYTCPPWDCTKIKSLCVFEGITTIGEYAFYKSTLTEIVLPESLNIIKNSAFEGANISSIKIPNGVTKIEDFAFYGCTNLTSIIIGDSVQTIGYQALVDCIGLETITVSVNNQYLSNDEYGVLFNKDKTRLIQYPIASQENSYIIPSSVEQIAENAFKRGDNLTSISIPYGVTTIGYNSFMLCTNLSNIAIPNSVDTIQSNAFAYCYKLDNIIIPNGVTILEFGVFLRCYNLTNIIIPDSVKTIDECAFSYCTNLKSATIPISTTIIGTSAFEYCNNLTDVYYSGTEEEWNAISIGNYNSSLTNATIHYNS